MTGRLAVLKGAQLASLLPDMGEGAGGYPTLMALAAAAGPGWEGAQAAWEAQSTSGAIPAASPS